MSEKQTFQTELEKYKTMDATSITIPFDVEKVFGKKRVPVKIKINDADYRTTIFRMDGRYCIVIPKKFREAAGVKGGDMITIELERDTEPRIIEPTEDLAKALNENPQAKESWEKLSYSHKKEFVVVLEEAKRAETRARRVQKIIEELTTKYARR
jgi:bifunctional DNA-binding transcriptional regulator/antitoxin component of YhaV-PrlF toxin-antitoxin module